MAESIISGNYGKVRSVAYTIPSHEYGAGVYTLHEGSKANKFGIPNNAKVIGVSNLGDNYKVVAYSVNDHSVVNYLRILIHNVTNTAITMEIPIRIFYTL